MATITQLANSPASSTGDVLCGGSQLGGTTTITGATGTINLGSLARVDRFYHITTTGATTILLPAVAKVGYRVSSTSAPGSAGAITVRNSANTLTIGPLIVAGNTSNILRTAAVETWSAVGMLLGTALRTAAFTGTSAATGNGTLSIASLGLTAAPLAVSANAYGPTNDCYTVSLKSKTATTITYETYDNLITVVIASNTAVKVGNVVVDFIIVY